VCWTIQCSLFGPSRVHFVAVQVTHTPKCTSQLVGSAVCFFRAVEMSRPEGIGRDAHAHGEPALLRSTSSKSWNMKFSTHSTHRSPAKFHQGAITLGLVRPAMIWMKGEVSTTRDMEGSDESQPAQTSSTHNPNSKTRRSLCSRCNIPPVQDEPRPIWARAASYDVSSCNLGKWLTFPKLVAGISKDFRGSSFSGRLPERTEQNVPKFCGNNSILEKAIGDQLGS